MSAEISIIIFFLHDSSLIFVNEIKRSKRNICVFCVVEREVLLCPSHPIPSLLIKIIHCPGQSSLVSCPSVQPRSLSYTPHAHCPAKLCPNPARPLPYKRMEIYDVSEFCSETSLSWSLMGPNQLIQNSGQHGRLQLLMKVNWNLEHKMHVSNTYTHCYRMLSMTAQIQWTTSIRCTQIL